MCFAPFSDIGDGAIDLSWVMAGVKSSQLFGVLVDTTKPPTDKSYYSYAKARAFMLQPGDTHRGTEKNHAKELCHSIHLQSYDAIVSVSGGGLVHEIINGIMSRKDWYSRIFVCAVLLLIIS